MNRRYVLALATVLGLALALPAAAQWKWRDKRGLTQYSDLPPPGGVPESDILQRPSAATRRTLPTAAAPASGASAAPLAASRASNPELEEKRKKAEQDLADKKSAEDTKVAAAKKENCGRARQQLRTIDSGQRMSRTNEKGERELLDDSARAVEAKRARDVMAADCQ